MKYRELGKTGLKAVSYTHLDVYKRQFRVGSVSVSGGEYYLQEDILSVLNIHEGDNLVLLATEDRDCLLYTSNRQYLID